MQLRRLLDLEEWDLREIFRPRTWPDGFWQHLAAHLVGGIGLWWGSRGDMRIATLLAAFWVLSVDEANTTRGFRYPIWAMLWDAGTMIAAAWALARWP
jgi:hypothetical protein